MIGPGEEFPGLCQGTEVWAGVVCSRDCKKCPVLWCQMIVKDQEGDWEGRGNPSGGTTYPCTKGLGLGAVGSGHRWRILRTARTWAMSDVLERLGSEEQCELITKAHLVLMKHWFKMVEMIVGLEKERIKTSSKKQAQCWKLVSSWMWKDESKDREQLRMPTCLVTYVALQIRWRHKSHGRYKMEAVTKYHRQARLAYKQQNCIS